MKTAVVERKPQEDARLAPEQVEQAASSSSIDLLPVGPSAATLQRALAEPGLVSAGEAQGIQRAYGNQFVQRLATGRMVQGMRSGSPVAPASDARPARKSVGLATTIAQRTGDGAAAAHPAIERRIEGQRGAGQSLPDSTRESMEGSFGADFSNVRVHTDAESGRLNRSLGARAFTTGGDVFFAENQYSPDNETGQKLLAHELTHVVQQGAAPTKAPQAKLEVSDPDDEYEREADDTAARVLDRKEDEAGEDLAPTGTPLVQTMRVQREEDPITEMTSEEELNAAQPDGDGQAPATAEDQEKLEDDTKAARTQGEVEGKQQGDKAASEQQAEDGGAGAEAGDRSVAGENVPDVPEAIEAPSDGIEIRSPDELEGDQAAAQEQATADAEAVADQFGWTASMPPDWDAEMMAHEAFKAIDQGGPETDAQEVALSVMPKQLADIQRSPDPALRNTLQRSAIQREEAAAQDKWVADDQTGSYSLSDFPYVPDAKPDVLVKTPKSDNKLAQVFVGDVAGKGAQAINAFAGLGKETNGFGVTAAILEGLVMLTEVLTNVLGFITLALALVAGILYAIGAATAWLGGSGLTLMAAATAIMTGPVAAISKAVFWITIVRMALRVGVIAFRGFDYLYAKYSQNMTEAELKKKEREMIGQTIGFAIDGVTAVIGRPAKVTSTGAGRATQLTTEKAALSLKGGVTSSTTSLAASIGKTAGVKAAVIGVKGTDASGASEALRMKADENAYAANDASDADDPLAAELAQSETGIAREGEEEGASGMPHVDAELPAPPVDAPVVIAGTSSQLAGAHEEKSELMGRLAAIDEMMGQKQEWNQDMVVTRAELASQKSTLAATDQMRGERIEAAEGFIATADENAGSLKESQSGFEQAGGTLSGSKSSIEAGMSRAEDEGTGAQVDKSQMASGPDTGRDGSAQAVSQAADGKNDAAASKAENLAITDESQEAQEQAEQANRDVAEMQDENLDEMDMLQQDKEGCLSRLEEIAAQEAEIMARRDEAVATANAWTEEHKAVREGELEPALAGAGEE